MLTSAQIQYLQSQGVSVTTINGREIKGGDAQYDSYFSDPQAASKFKDFVKDSISESVDGKISKKYTRITNPRYVAKHQEALSFKLNGYTGSDTDFPFLKAEAAELSITMTSMADLIISAANTYNANAALVERRRVQFNSAVDSATTLDQINTLWRQAEVEVEGL